MFKNNYSLRILFPLNDYDNYFALYRENKKTIESTINVLYIKKYTKNIISFSLYKILIVSIIYTTFKLETVKTVHERKISSHYVTFKLCLTMHDPLPLVSFLALIIPGDPIFIYTPYLLISTITLN